MVLAVSTPGHAQDDKQIDAHIGQASQRAQADLYCAYCAGEPGGINDREQMAGDETARIGLSARGKPKEVLQWRKRTDEARELDQRTP